MEILLMTYLASAIVTFSAGFKLFWDDATTPMTDQMSWLVLIVGTVLWPVVVPISTVQVISKNKQVVQTFFKDDLLF